MRIKQVLYTNLHFIWVICFFIVHGFRQYFSLIPLVQIGLLWLQLLAGSTILFLVFKRIYRKPQKAGIAASMVIALMLFFGVLQEFLGNIQWLALLARLVWLVPLCTIAVALFLVWLKKTRSTFNRAVVFINVLLLVYTLVDVAGIAVKALADKRPQNTLAEKYGLTDCAGCSRPSVYLIVLDEYMGFKGLEDYFGYANTHFKDSLQMAGFHVVNNSTGNYLLTIFSMASLLNMDYLEKEGPMTIKNHYAYKKAMAGIRDNMVCRYFAQQGYRINNHSDFDLQHHPAGYSSELPDKIRLITNQTLYHRVAKALPPLLANKFNISLFALQLENEVIMANEEKMERTLASSRNASGQPAFTWLHLMMPHEPFAFDSLGRRTPNGKSQFRSTTDRDAAYLQYLVYTNRRMMTFIRQLQQQTKGEAVIVLMSDHGYRNAWKKSRQACYQTLNAIYLPGRDYTGWYNGMSHVNQFRVLFNKLFHQQLPLLPDSVVVQ